MYSILHLEALIPVNLLQWLLMSASMVGAPVNKEKQLMPMYVRFGQWLEMWRTTSSVMKGQKKRYIILSLLVLTLGFCNNAMTCPVVNLLQSLLLNEKAMSSSV